MDPRVLILTLPSLAVLGLLVLHSFRALPRARASAFWISVVAYGLVRGVALRWVIEHGLGASFPYAIRNPLIPIFGVPLQELAGWAIVAYIGWWLGCRLSRSVFAQVVWACVFLAAVSWAVEAAAVAAGWWSWTVPVTVPFFINVPFIAIVDWAFVGIDFVLPFVVLTAPQLRAHPARFLTLLAFPVHFGAHCFAGSFGPMPIPHVAHWILLAVLLWLTLRSETMAAPFEKFGLLPLVGLAIVLVDVVVVEIVMVRRPELLVSIVPVLVVSLVVLHPVVPGAVERLLASARRRPFVPAVAVIAVAMLGLVVHSAGARSEGELKRRLDAALAARDRGDLDGAKRELDALVKSYPGSHVPPALLGEIDYRMERLEEAHTAFERAVAIKQDYAKGYRYLAVIELRQGRKTAARDWASRGLAILASDPELLYLSGSRGVPPATPQAALGLAALAFEVRDVESAAAYLDEGLRQWPDQRPLYAGRAKLALQAGDLTAARRVIAAWRERFPQDAEAGQLSRQVGMD